MSDELKPNEPGKEVEKTGTKQDDASKENSGNPTVKGFAGSEDLLDAKPSAINPAKSNSRHKTKHCTIMCLKDWLEIIGLVAGIIVAFLLYEQWREMVKATNAAVSQSKVMQGQLDEMQQTRIQDERAWLFLAQITNMPDEFYTNNRLIVAVFRNTGRTPAFHVHGSIAFTMDADAIPELDYFATPHTDMTIAPDGTSPSILPMSEISPLDIQSITNRQPGYVFGAAWYDDIFGKHHWTQFCFVIEPNLITFKAYPDHNECDDTAGQTHVN